MYFRRYRLPRDAWIVVMRGLAQLTLQILICRLNLVNVSVKFNVIPDFAIF